MEFYEFKTTGDKRFFLNKKTEIAYIVDHGTACTIIFSVGASCHDDINVLNTLDEVMDILNDNKKKREKNY